MSAWSALLLLLSQAKTWRHQTNGKFFCKMIKIRLLAQDFMPPADSLEKYTVSNFWISSEQPCSLGQSCSPSYLWVSSNTERTQTLQVNKLCLNVLDAPPLRSLCSNLPSGCYQGLSAKSKHPFWPSFSKWYSAKVRKIREQTHSYVVFLLLQNKAISNKQKHKNFKTAITAHVSKLLCRTAKVCFFVCLEGHQVLQ